MDRADVDRWLARYVAAWKSGDPAEIGDLFSAGCRYRYDNAFLLVFDGDERCAGLTEIYLKRPQSA